MKMPSQTLLTILKMNKTVILFPFGTLSPKLSKKLIAVVSIKVQQSEKWSVYPKTENASTNIVRSSMST